MASGYIPEKIIHYKLQFAILIFLIFLTGYIVLPNIIETDSDQSNELNNNTVMDIDGNIYHVIKIGDQTWMAENLRTTRFNDGETIPYVTGDNDWSNLRSPGFCWPKNDESNREDYGALYNWYAVDTGKLALKGWHIPTIEEWEILADNLGGSSNAGEKLKEIGFADSLAGDRIYTGEYVYVDEVGKYWASSDGGWHPSDAWYRSIALLENMLGLSSHPKMDGHSVRCIKDS